MHSTSDPLRIGSLCTGYGGLDTGAAAALGRCELAWTADNDPAASAVIAYRYPGIPNYGDIRVADWRHAPSADVVCAGFPCQPISAAGKQKGTADERWIWPAITAAISRLAVRPSLLIFENVPRILTSEGGAVHAQVTRSLAELGYVGCWGIYSAAEAGAPHLRKRWFLAAADAQGVGRPAWLTAVQRQRTDPCDKQPVPDTGSKQLQRRGIPGLLGSAQDPEPGERHQRQRAGNPAGDRRAEAVPHADRGMRERRPDQPLRRTPEREAPERNRSGAFPDTRSARLQGTVPAHAGVTAQRQRQAEDSTADGSPICRGGPDWREYEPAVRRWEQVTGHPVPYPVEPGRNGKSRMNAAFPEWLMGLPPGWVTGVPGLSRSAQIRVIGNGVVPHQAAMAITSLLDIMKEGTRT